MITPVLRQPLLAACALAASLAASATPIVETGHTVARADFTLTFDAIHDGTDLAVYEESGIFVTTPSLAYTGTWVFHGDERTTGFHYANGGNESYTTIRGVNKEVFGAVDFLFGNGWQSPESFVRYATYLDGVRTGTGVAEAQGGIMRITDLGGFDELWLNAHNLSPAEFGTSQALALDDLHLQLWDAQMWQPQLEPAALVPEPRQFALFGAALLALSLVRRKWP